MTEKEQEKQELSGLDMRPAIEFYQRNLARIVERMPKVDYDRSSSYPIETEHPLDVHEYDISSIVNSFPREFLKRSVLEKIILKPSLWFKEDPATFQGNPTTQNANEALFPTAFIPGFTDAFGKNLGEGRYSIDSADVHLYKTPEGKYGTDIEQIRRIILLQALAHEIAHTVISPEINPNNDRKIIMPGTKIAIPSIEELIRYAGITEKHEPISGYAKNFRKNFASSNPSVLAQAINEDLAETIAAHLLNFSSCGEDTRGLDPMKDRPEVKKFVEDYMNARRAE